MPIIINHACQLCFYLLLINLFENAFSKVLSLREAATLYNDSDNIIELDPTNFQELVLNDHDVWVVEFYASWCPHCKKFVPEYKKLARNTKGLLKVGAIDASRYPQLNDIYDIKSFPTILIFGFNKYKPIVFKGKRLAEHIFRTVLNELQQNLV